MDLLIQKRRFTVDEFHRMGEAGVFKDGDRVELIDGEIITMTPIGPAHAGCVNRLTALLVPKLGSAALLAPQNPVLLDDRSEPQPDVVLLRARPDYYSDTHPAPADVLLVVEVSDTSVGFDRRVKAPLYARAGVPELWIVDLGGRLVEIYRRPDAGAYAEQLAVGPGERLELPGVSNQSIAVADVLG